MQLRCAVACMCAAHVDTPMGTDGDGPVLERFLQANTQLEVGEGQEYDVHVELDKLTQSGTWGSAALMFPLATLKNRPVWVTTLSNAGGTSPVQVYAPLEQLEHSVFHLPGCQDCAYDPNPIILRFDPGPPGHYDTVR